MILDNIEHLSRYTLPFKDKIVAYLNSRDPQTVPDGEHEIDGRNLFVRVMSEPLKPASENKFELHRIYADLQFIAQGVELMQVTSPDQLTPVTEYDQKGDYQFFMPNNFISDLVLRQGQFTIFYPGQPHRPSCRYQNHPGPNKKLVFKIKY